MNDKVVESRVQLGRFLKDRRAELDIGADVLAGVLGISENTLNRIESGRFAWDIDLHIKICEILKISIQYEHG